ncbi:MAG: SH3 domain-containing protein [Pseudomonadota bacterium]
MRLASLLVGVGTLLAGGALAAEGDALLVTGSNVNVRAGPSTDAGILTRVGIDEPAIERRRVDDWVEVALPVQDVLGWIHQSLLAAAPQQATQPPAAPALVEIPETPQQETVAAPGNETASGESAPEPATTTLAATDGTGGGVSGTSLQPTDGSPLSQFRSEVEYFNDRALAAAGVDLFTGVEPLGEGGVQVVATDAWATMSVPGQQSYVNALFGRWRAAAGDDQILTLQIVDPDGTLMMEKSGP